MKTVKREAIVGERILITRAIAGSYKEGDVFTVSKTYGNGVHVEEHRTYIFHMEYEVIEDHVEMPHMKYVEIAEPFGKQVREMIHKAYTEGYERGKSEMLAEFMTPEETKETPQAKRDRIVEQAKKDVEKLKKEFVTYSLLRTKFVINREKRTVVCLLERFDLGYIAKRGIAKCAPDDCFNVWIGKAIALRRALGLDIPFDYLTVPNPTEVRVGDVMKVSVDDGTVEVKSVISTEGYGRLNVHLPGRSIQFPADYAEIIDDSREEETE